MPTMVLEKAKVQELKDYIAAMKEAPGLADANYAEGPGAFRLLVF